MTFARFVRMASNEVAFDTMLHWSVGAPHVPKVLVLTGPAGVGKTHLARAAAAVWEASHPHERIRILPAADLLHQISWAISQGLLTEVHERIELSPGPFVLEHCEDLAGKPASCAALFEVVKRASRQVLLTVTQKARTQLYRAVRTAFPEAQVLEVARAGARDRVRVRAAVEARRAARRELPTTPDDTIRRILRDFVDDSMHEFWLNRPLVVVDDTTSDLEASLREKNLYVIAAGEQLKAPDAVAGMLTHRIVVTRDTPRYLDDAPVHEHGIIGLDALRFSGDVDLPRMISVAIKDHSLREPRSAFVLLLHPAGRHVYRRLS